MKTENEVIEMTVKEFLDKINPLWKGKIKITSNMPSHLRAEEKSKKIIEVCVLPARGIVRCYTDLGLCEFSAKNILQDGTLGDKYIEFVDEEVQVRKLIFSSQKHVTLFWWVLQKIQKSEEMTMKRFLETELQIKIKAEDIPLVKKQNIYNYTDCTQLTNVRMDIDIQHERIIIYYKGGMHSVFLGEINKTLIPEMKIVSFSMKEGYYYFLHFNSEEKTKQFIAVLEKIEKSKPIPVS